MIKKLIFSAILLPSILSFSPMVTSAATPGEVQIYLYSNEHSVDSSFAPMNLYQGEVVQFWGDNDASSTHQVALSLYDPSGNYVDGVVINPGDSLVGDSVSAPVAGNYTITLACGGTGQTGCTADGTLQTVN